MAINWRRTAISTGLILAIIVVIALRETGAIAQFGIAAVVLVTPGFILALYRLWEARDRLVEHTEMATDSFRALKAVRKMNKEEKEKQKQEEKQHGIRN